MIIDRSLVSLMFATALVAVTSAAAGQDDAGSATNGPSNPRPATKTTPAQTPSTDANSTAGRANASADQAAGSANRAVVGDASQNENEQEAQKASQAAAANKAARPGATNRQADPAAGQVGTAASDATNTVATGVDDITRSTDNSAHYNPFAIEMNPLGLFEGGRLSFNLEWVPTTHHAIVVSPHFIHTTAEISTSGSTTASQAFSGFGGELGYRYYTGHRGMTGVFVGPSLIAGVYNAGLPSGNQAFTNIGIAADLGLQQTFWDHFVLGGGVGIEYLSVSHDFQDLPTGPSIIASSGVKPRLLLEAGYGF